VPKGGRRAALAATLVLGLATAAMLAPTAACTTHECDQSFTTFDMATQGIKTDFGEGLVQWSSSSWEGVWLDYPGGRILQINLPTGFVPAGAPTVWVSTAQDQDASGATSTSASGLLDQVFAVTSNSIDLNNGSCAEYYVWFSIVGTQTLAEAGVEAGAEAGSDAGVDAAADAPHD
jgi:hypothetical protein